MKLKKANTEAKDETELRVFQSFFGYLYVEYFEAISLFETICNYFEREDEI